MNSKIEKKLRSYSLLAGTMIGAIPAVDGAVVYTNIDPDLTFSNNGDTYNLDLNNDAVVDFKIALTKVNYTYNYGSYSYQVNYKFVQIQPQASNNGLVMTNTTFINSSGSVSSAYVAQGFQPNAVVNSNLMFYSGTTTSSLILAADFYQNSNGNINSIKVGKFLGQMDRYLGLRFQANGNTYYGWARLDVPSDATSFTIKDYAYDSTANMPIITGLVPGVAGAVSNVVAMDVANNGNASDINLSFDKALDETTVSEYRAIVLKSSDFATFDLPTANTISAPNLEVITKTGSNISLTLSPTTKDKNGDPIINGQPYRVCVLSVADGVNAFVNNMNCSQELTLEAPTTPASNAKLADVGNNLDPSDIELTFDKSADESNIDHYRAFLVPQVNAGSFNLSVAESTVSPRYTDIPKTGSNITTTLDAGSKDINGNQIVTGQVYVAFVMSVADGVNTTTNSLSAASDPVTIMMPAVVASDVQAQDIGDNGNGKDLKVTFIKAADESGVGHYRIIVVKKADVALFDLAAADAVIMANYTSVPKTGSNIVHELDSNSNDASGDPVMNNEPYQVFVLSVADGTNANQNALSQPSEEITLTSAPSGMAYRIGWDDVKIYTAGHQLTVETPKEILQTGDASLEVFNLSGQQLFRSRINSSRTQIDLQAQTGVYLVQLRLGDAVHQKKVFVP